MTTQWFVASAHRVPSTKLGSTWMAYGVRHAHAAGEALTACGELTVMWHHFWDQPFRIHAPGSCDACSEAVASTIRRARVGL
jgi:hypothetical protein